MTATHRPGITSVRTGEQHRLIVEVCAAGHISEHWWPMCSAHNTGTKRDQD